MSLPNEKKKNTKELMKKKPTVIVLPDRIENIL